nr:hypothetical protein CFP56_42315 [Quercus suber]
MERFYKSQPVTYHGGTQNATMGTTPQRTTQSLRITEVVDSGAHTPATATGKSNEPCKENLISVEEVLQPGPSNTEILNNQDLFQTHLEEIDRDLGTRPTVTRVDSIGTTHGNGITHTDIKGAQVEENNMPKAAGSRVTDKASSKQDDTEGPGLVRTLGTWKRVTDKIRPMDTRDSTSTNSGPK